MLLTYVPNLPHMGSTQALAATQSWNRNYITATFLHNCVDTADTSCECKYVNMLMQRTLHSIYVRKILHQVNGKLHLCLYNWDRCRFHNRVSSMWGKQCWKPHQSYKVMCDNRSSLSELPQFPANIHLIASKVRVNVISKSKVFTFIYIYKWKMWGKLLQQVLRCPGSVVCTVSSVIPSWVLCCTPVRASVSKQCLQCRKVRVLTPYGNNRLPFLREGS